MDRRPGNAADFPISEAFDCFAEQAACFLTPETNDRTSVSPFGIRLGDRIHGHPLQIDLSEKSLRMGKIAYWNKFVLGGSGSGKSFFTNHLMHSYNEQNVHIVILDTNYKI